MNRDVIDRSFPKLVVKLFIWAGEKMEAEVCPCLYGQTAFSKQVPLRGSFSSGSSAGNSTLQLNQVTVRTARKTIMEEITN